MIATYLSLTAIRKQILDPERGARQIGAEILQEGVNWLPPVQFHFQQARFLARASFLVMSDVEISKTMTTHFDEKLTIEVLWR